MCAAMAPACIALRAAVSDDEAELIARKAVCDFRPSEHHVDAAMNPDKLRAVRFGELEDRILQFEARTAPRQIGKALELPEPLYLYRVTNEGIFLLPQEKIGPRDWPTAEVVFFDANREWVVAVSRRTGEAFDLYGFGVTGEAEPVAAFNRLVARFHLSALDNNTADELAILFYRCVFDPDERDLMGYWLHLRLRVEEYAYRKFDERPAGRLFSTWWRQFNRSAKYADIEISSHPGSGGFQVELPVFRVLPKSEVALIKRTVTVSADGTCRLEPDATVFQYPMRDRGDEAHF